jgi:Fis family transcriptional regulator
MSMEEPLHRSEGRDAGSDTSAPGQQSSSLRKDVERSLHHYFAQLGDASVTNLYELVLHEIEAPLLKAVLRHTGSNQSKASIMLGLNRGTLRKKLKQHGLL